MKPLARVVTAPLALLALVLGVARCSSGDAPSDTGPLDATGDATDLPGDRGNDTALDRAVDIDAGATPDRPAEVASDADRPADVPGDGDGNGSADVPGGGDVPIDTPAPDGGPPGDGGPEAGVDGAAGDAASEAASDAINDAAEAGGSPSPFGTCVRKPDNNYGLPSSETCTPGAQRCSGLNVQECSPTGTQWLHLQTCFEACVGAGECTDARYYKCVIGQRRCNGSVLEQCKNINPSVTDWLPIETCATFCYARAPQCALPSLDVTGPMTLPAAIDPWMQYMTELVVAGPVVVHAGGVLTGGVVTLRADSVVVEEGGVLQAGGGSTQIGAGRTGYSGGGIPTCQGASAAGGGGSYATRGTGPGADPCEGSPGRTWGIDNESLVLSGSVGGAGVGTNGVPSIAGGGGGNLRVVANTITIAGKVDVHGSDGLRDLDPAGGAGSGGGVLLAARTLKVSGTISALGGTGGRGRINGGDGGLGRIKLLTSDSASITGTLAGVVTQGRLPPPLITSTSHPYNYSEIADSIYAPKSTIVYEDGFDHASFSWEKVSPSGYYVLVDNAVGTLPTADTGQFVATEGIRLPACAFVDGINYVHVVAAAADRSAGTVQTWFPIWVNTRPPFLTSLSHADTRRWYSNNSPSFSWVVHDRLEEVGAHFTIDHFATTVPTTADPFAPTDASQTAFVGLADGLWFFHVTLKDRVGNLTRTPAHFPVHIGADPGLGRLFGHVVDGSGAALADAVVTINRGLDTRTTDASGGYDFPASIAGQWELRVSKPGRTTFTDTITIVKDQSTMKDVSLP